MLLLMYKGAKIVNGSNDAESQLFSLISVIVEQSGIFWSTNTGKVEKIVNTITINNFNVLYKFCSVYFFNT